MQKHKYKLGNGEMEKKLKNNIKRIAIIGAPGTGKTTLANNLGKIYNLPVLHLDTIHYMKNWVLRDTKQRDKMIIEEGKKEKWILDGTFIDTLVQRTDRADLIIFLDYPRRTQLKGIFKRKITHLGKKRAQIPRLDLSFVLYVFTYNKKRRGYITDILKKYNSNKILVFQKQNDLEKWVRSLYIENNIPCEEIIK